MFFTLNFILDSIPNYDFEAYMFLVCSLEGASQMKYVDQQNNNDPGMR